MGEGGEWEEGKTVPFLFILFFLLSSSLGKIGDSCSPSILRTMGLSLVVAIAEDVGHGGMVRVS